MGSVVYTLGIAVLAAVGVIAVRRPHRRLLVVSSLAVPVGCLAAGLGLLAGGAGALVWMYLGALIALVGMVGVVVFVVGERRSEANDHAGSRLMPPL